MNGFFESVSFVENMDLLKELQLRFTVLSDERELFYLKQKPFLVTLDLKFCLISSDRISCILKGVVNRSVLNMNMKTAYLEKEELFETLDFQSERKKRRTVEKLKEDF